MDLMTSLLEYCRDHVAHPMFEAVGRAFTAIFRPLMEALSPADAARNTIVQYIASRNGGNVDRARDATLDTGENIVDVLEKAILEFIQRYGRTGGLLRAGVSQSAYDRTRLNMSSQLATGMVKYEAGIARILFEDIHAFAYMCGHYYRDICKATGIIPDMLEDTVDMAKLDRFKRLLLPMITRHTTDSYVNDNTREWKPVSEYGTLGANFNETKGKGRILTYDDLDNMYAKQQYHDVIEPKANENKSNLVVKSDNDVHNPTYDIYYIPNKDALVKFMREHKHPSVYVDGFSRWGNADVGPWCIATFGWAEYVCDEGGTAYMCLKSDWEETTSDMVSKWQSDSSGSRFSDEYLNLKLSCFACVVRGTGSGYNFISAEGRDDYDMPRRDLPYMSKLLGLTEAEIKELMPAIGEDNARYECVRVAKGQMLSAGSISTDDYVAAFDKIIRSGRIGSDRYKIADKEFVLSNAYEAVDMLYKHGFDPLLYVAASHDGENYYVLLVNVGGKYRIFGHTVLTQVNAMNDGHTILMRTTDMHDYYIDSATLRSVKLHYNSIPYNRQWLNSYRIAYHDREGNAYVVLENPDTLVRPNREVVPIEGGKYIGIHDDANHFSMKIRRDDGVYVPCNLEDSYDRDDIGSILQAGAISYYSRWFVVLHVFMRTFVIITRNDGKIHGPYERVGYENSAFLDNEPGSTFIEAYAEDGTIDRFDRLGNMLQQADGVADAGQDGPDGAEAPAV